MVRTVLGQGFADASVPFPVVRTDKGVGSHLAFLPGAGCHGALPTEDENAFRLLWGDQYVLMRDQSKSEKSPLPPGKKRTFFFLSEKQKAFSFDSKDIVLENQS